MALSSETIIAEFAEFLDRLERESKESVDTLNQLIQNDSKMGYAKASGHAQSSLEWVAISARSFRQTYLTQADHVS